MWLCLCDFKLSRFETTQACDGRTRVVRHHAVHWVGWAKWSVTVSRPVGLAESTLGVGVRARLQAGCAVRPKRSAYLMCAATLQCRFNSLMCCNNLLPVVVWSSLIHCNRKQPCLTSTKPKMILWVKIRRFVSVNFWGRLSYRTNSSKSQLRKVTL